VAEPAAPAERVLVVGGPGSGKTTFALRVAAATGIPVHHLDEVARVGGGTGPERSSAERAADVARIVASDRWIAEGVHLGWTSPLFEAADTIVWLDHVAWRGTSRRMVRRFVTQAIAEARRRRGRERFLRFRDYARRLGDVAKSIPEARRYQRNATSRPGAAGGDPTRAATERAVAPHTAKLIHCRIAADVDTALARLSARDPVAL
jgi:adenylate kinase family enzyme